MQQVSGSEKSLLISIRDGEDERPGLRRWNAWQVWRAAAGRRPLLSRGDECTTTGAMESALWKSVMLEIFCENLLMELASGEADRPEEAREFGARTEGSRLEPAAVAEQQAAAAAAPAAQQQSPARDSAGTDSPQAGVGSPVPSWTSASPGSPGTLLRTVLKAYQPDKELLETYAERVGRQVAVLQRLGVPLETSGPHFPLAFLKIASFHS